MIKIAQISLIAVVAIAIGALMLPTSLAPSALAHYDKHKSHGDKHIKIELKNKAHNECAASSCTNTNSQSASVSGHHGSVSISESNHQSNECFLATCSNSNTQTATVS